MALYDPARSEKPHFWHKPGVRHAALACVAAIPVLLVNSTAFIGQYAFLRQHVPWPEPGIALIAVTVESIAVYIAWHAHMAQMKNDSAARLKLGAYTFALIIGVMNYSHYAAPHWRPTVMAVIMFFMSALSPWLWGIHSRRASRDALMARRLIDERGVRLGFSRWLWYPVRSVQATRWAAWFGINEQERVLAHFEPRWGTADTPYVPRQGKGAPRQDLPAQTAPVLAPAAPRAGVPAPDAPALPGAAASALPAAPGAPDPYAAAQMIPGTQLNGATHSAEAELLAFPVMSGRRKVVVPPAAIDAVIRRLAALPTYAEVERVSRREIARWLDENSDQRRLAGQLKTKRLDELSRQLQVPRPVHSLTSNGMIHPSVASLPGGTAAAMQN